MFLAFVAKHGFYLAFVLVSQLCGRNPFAMEKQFAFRSKADDIMLFQVIRFEEHFVVIKSLCQKVRHRVP